MQQYVLKDWLSIAFEIIDNIFEKNNAIVSQSIENEQKFDQVQNVLNSCSNQLSDLMKTQNYNSESITIIQNSLEQSIKQLKLSKVYPDEQVSLQYTLDKIAFIKSSQFMDEKKENNLLRPYRIILNRNQQNLSPILIFQNPQKLPKKESQNSSNQKYQLEIQFKGVLEQLNNKNKIINPLKLVINKKIDVDNPEVLFYVLGDQMRRVNQAFFISQESDARFIYSFHGQFTNDSNDSQAYSLILNETSTLNYNTVTSDQNLMVLFITKLKESLSIDLKVHKHQIIIISLENDQIKVIFDIIDQSGAKININTSEQFAEVQKQFQGSKSKVQLHQYFKEAALSPNDFDPQYDKVWDKYEFGNYSNKGPRNKPQPHFYPVGWQGFGLKVLGRYGDNDNWLKRNNDEEWYTMFHGTSFGGVQGIMKDDQQLKPGQGQVYEKTKCLLTEQLIGKGVYFSNHIEVCEGYATPTLIGDQMFIVAFQSRVKPEALRKCKKISDIRTEIDEYKKNQLNHLLDKSLDNMDMWDNDYFVINKACDIRPGRILLKNVTQKVKVKETSNQFEKSLQTQIRFIRNKYLKPLEYFKNQANLSVQDPLKSLNQKYQFEFQFKEVFLRLNKKQNIINPLQLVIKKNINIDNPEVLFYVLSDQMRRIQREFFKSLQFDELLLYSFHGQFTDNSNNSQAYSLTLQDTPTLSYQAISSDKELREQFIKKIIYCLSKDFKVEENNIQILALQKNCIKIIFEVLGEQNQILATSNDLKELQKQFPKNKVQLQLHNYFKDAALSVNDFDAKHNMTWEIFNYGTTENRGPKDKPQPYFFPIGWKGFALNVSGKYGENDNWLKMDGNKEEWYVMFHGTNFGGCQAIMNKGEQIQGNLPNRHPYEQEKCLLTGKLIGQGVYFSNHIEVCEGRFVEPTQIGHKSFILAFQSRVKPDALRQCEKQGDNEIKQIRNEQKEKNQNKKKQNDLNLDDQKLWDNEYFVINNTCDIRPYRILLKDVTENEK